MRFLQVTGVRQVAGILFYVTVDGVDMQVSERLFDKVDNSLRQGDVWIYDKQAKQIIKYGAQLNLFEERVMDEEIIDL